MPPVAPAAPSRSRAPSAPPPPPPRSPDRQRQGGEQEFQNHMRNGSGAPSGQSNPVPAPPANDGRASGATSTSRTDGAPPANGAATPTGAASETARAGSVVANPRDEIGRLNSDGDRVVMSVTGEGKLQVPVPVGNVPVGVGVKGQYGYDIAVEQVGGASSAAGARPGAAPAEPPQYEVTFDKRLQAGLTGEPPIPGIDPAVELNFRTADSVAMRFENPDDAARAVGVLQRLAAAETVRDAGNIPSPGAASNPVPNGGAASGPSIPASPAGIATNVIADRLQPSDADMQFLRDNTSSFTQRVGVNERGKVAAKFANLGIEPRLDGTQEISRTVELPRNGEPGRLTYTLSGDLQASTKEKLTVGKQAIDQLEIGYVPQNVVDHGTARGEVSMSWDLPPGAAFSTVSGRPVPEAGLIGEGRLDNPDRVSARLSLEHQTQGLTDLSRTDQRRFGLEVTTENPGRHVGPTISNLMGGDLQGAFRRMGDDFTVTAESDRVARNGVEQQHEIGVEVADVAEAKVSLIGEIGRDDVYDHRSRTVTGTQIADRLGGPVAPGEAPPAEPRRPDQLVVTPREGLNVRAEPSTAGREVSAFQHGTFVQPTGARQTDAGGREWVEVQGLDDRDRQVQGWVASRYVEPSQAGAMDGQGRVSPELERQGYRAHRVQPGDNLWDIAHRDGANFGELVRLNGQHLRDPSLVFPGDKVYLPGTGQAAAAPPPARVAPESRPVLPQPPAAPPSAPSGAASSRSAPNPASPAHPSAPSGPGQVASAGPTAPAPEAPSAASPSGQTGAPPTGSPPNRAAASGQPSGQPAAPSIPTTPGQPPAGPAPTVAGRPDLGRVLAENQVPADTMVEFRPRVGPFTVPGFLAEPVQVTSREADLLGSLSVNELQSMQDIKSKSFAAADREFPPPAERRGDFPSGPEGDAEFAQWAGNDGHNDAFRHAYWNALMTKRFGGPENGEASFADRFATAHEGAPGNAADREAMDLHNNRVGREIAEANPNASEEELATLVRQAIDDGRTVVIDRSGNLAWSDGMRYGEHGAADDRPGAGGPMPRPAPGGPATSDADPTDSGR